MGVRLDDSRALREYQARKRALRRAVWRSRAKHFVKARIR